jgi:Tol biopolymer transport system component
VSVVALIGPQAALGTFPGRNGLIAVGGEGFRLTCPHSWNIHVVQPDGSGLRPLTRSGRCTKADRWAPDWTADGQRLLFADFGFLGSMAADGSDVQRLPQHSEILAINGQPSISHDWQHVVFEADDSQIWLEGLDGTGLRRLRGGTRPRWSPSGRMIAVAADDGRLVLRDAATDEALVARRFARHDVHSVDWSPDEREMLMVMEPRRGRGRWLATVTVDDPASRARRIRLPRRFRSARWRVGTRAVWSPDGRRIAFIAYRSIQYELGRPSLWVMRADGRHLRRLLIGERSGAELEESVSWQPILP